VSAAPKKTSAVALMDALGFSDVWKNPDPGAAVNALARVRALVTSLKSHVDGGGFHYFAAGPLELHVGWFSDTIAIVAQASHSQAVFSDGQQLRTVLVNAVSMCVGYVLRDAAEMQPPLVFRGAVTVGDAFIYPEQVWIGPAISQAAKLYEEADGAFVLLSPEASVLPDGDVDFADVLVDYEVPLKGGSSRKARVVSPFTHVSANSAAGASIRAGIEQAMATEDAAVSVKRKNTLSFLDHIAEISPYQV
jgi:hypothetical protein